MPRPGIKKWWRLSANATQYSSLYKWKEWGNTIDKIDFLTLAAECEDALQLNSMLKTVQSDLLFLDIEMSQLSGFEFFWLISRRLPG